MKKSSFYSTIIALALGVSALPTVAFAQNTQQNQASAQQPAVTIADFETASAAETPDLTILGTMITSLLAQDANNLTAIQEIVATLPAELQAALNEIIAATGATANTTTNNTPTIPTPPPVLPTNRATSDTTDTGGDDIVTSPN